MTDVQFRIAGRDDAAQLNTALAALSAELGDCHRSEVADLMRAIEGTHPAFRAILAEVGTTLVGVAVYSPLFSTSRGCVVAYVSDLWVLTDHRGTGLGQNILRAVMHDARSEWDARWMKLTVYDTSPAARRFYERLGFGPAEGSTEMHLDTSGCTALGGDV
ncbi:GNAT family N-acetyltransferase [Pseudohalocynthiibacter aestuariivivens]|nr:GNAT family N-acetyltransferase [Pseudohalocynthiibacter aestuariivivens]QIE47132.1 GNAT family N-acetyltransferase [Pseudohalocynthiibacter aestuariivivens]